MPGEQTQALYFISIHFISIYHWAIAASAWKNNQGLLCICGIDFFNFRHCQVQNFEISNQSEQHQNFAVNFQKHQKQKRKSTKNIATEQKQSIIPRKFHKISLVL